MSIFLSRDNKVIVQGITGSEATVHTARMLRAGTQIVGGERTQSGHHRHA